MKFPRVLASVVLLTGGVQSGMLWDGRFNDLTSSSDLSKWSWTTQSGPYQYYIHGNGPVTEYVNLGTSFKNSADSGSKQGAKITLTNTAYWNGQNMRRTELIPQTGAAINQGKVFYHFSLMRSDINPPATTREHQIAFFESHFTEMKAGWLSGASGTSDPLLRWCVSGQTKWSTNWDAGVWHNIAYEIDFSAGTVGFWHSTGADSLVRVIAPVPTSTSSNGADWHVGVLELPRNGYSDTTEDFYFSGVYIENGSITTSVSGPGLGPSITPTSSSRTSITISSSVTISNPASTSKMLSTFTSSTPGTTTTPPPTSGGAEHYQQCGGMGNSGPSFCNAPYVCSTLNPYYAQCL